MQPQLSSCGAVHDCIFSFFLCAFPTQPPMTGLKSTRSGLDSTGTEYALWFASMLAVDVHAMMGVWALLPLVNMQIAKQIRLKLSLGKNTSFSIARELPHIRRDAWICCQTYTIYWSYCAQIVAHAAQFCGPTLNVQNFTVSDSADYLLQSNCSMLPCERV